MTDQDDLIDDLSEDVEEEDLPSDKDTEDYEPSADVMDIDETMKKTIGNKPDPTKPFSIADEVEEDEEDRRDAPEDN